MVWIAVVQAGDAELLKTLPVNIYPRRSMSCYVIFRSTQTYKRQGYSYQVVGQGSGHHDHDHQDNPVNEAGPVDLDA